MRKFTRRGDCHTCDGTGHHQRWACQGVCYTCQGTGGERPPEGSYRVEVIEGGPPKSTRIVGHVIKVKGGWLAHRLDGTQVGDVHQRRQDAGKALT